MNQSEVITALAQAGLFRGPWVLDDLVYEPVSADFIAGAARAWVDTLLPDGCTEMRDIGGGKTLRFPKWIPEAGDCDNIAKCFAAYLSLCEWLKAAKSATPLGNIAAGLLRFCPDNADGQGHAVNWHVDYDGNVHVFDAGAMAERDLSPNEKLSIYGGETI